MSAVSAPGGRGWAGKTLLLARKDLVIEVRGRDTLPPMLVFSLAVTLLLAFTLPDTSRPSTRIVLPAGTASVADVLAGFIWVTVLFAGLVGFARSFEVERHEGAIDALLLVPLDRSGLYLAKAMTNLAFIVAVELFLFPVFAVLFPIGLGAGVVAIVLLVDVGFVAIGTLFAALAAQTRSRELMLPVLAFPVLVPVFIAAVELTSDLFLGRPTRAVVSAGWFGILLAFDLIYVVVGALTFEFVIE
ncbi:heme exporter protein CcmB [soil metagenome]|nr:heme exporter protein CcmB [Actinomycetota bacterium]MDQ3532776.1 heme exporter protein CcmB [Actinomycetota bacterium]